MAGIGCSGGPASGLGEPRVTGERTGEEAERAAVAALVERYLACFNAADFVGACACYRLPFTWFFDARPTTAATPDEFDRLMRRSRAALAAAGLARSDLLDCSVEVLGPHAALARVAVCRLRADGSQLEAPTGGTYVVHHDGTGWRLAAFLAHPLRDA